MRSSAGVKGHIYLMRHGGEISRFLNFGKPFPRSRDVSRGAWALGYGEAWGTFPQGSTKTIASGDSAPMETDGANRPRKVGSGVRSRRSKGDSLVFAGAT